MDTFILADYYQSTPLDTAEVQGGGGGTKILVGTVVKANVGDLEEEVRDGFSRPLRKELTGVVQGVYWKKKFLVRLQDGCEKYPKSNKLTVATVEKIPMEEEPGVPTITEIPDEIVPS